MDSGVEEAPPSVKAPSTEAPVSEALSSVDLGIVSPETQEQVAKVEVVIQAGAEVKSNTTELKTLVKAHRLQRLDRHAAKYHWSLDEPPLQAATNPEVLDWWNEWRSLRVAQEAKMARAAKEVRVPASAPVEMAAPQ